MMSIFKVDSLLRGQAEENRKFHPEQHCVIVNDYYVEFGVVNTCRKYGLHVVDFYAKQMKLQYVVIEQLDYRYTDLFDRDIGILSRRDAFKFIAGRDHDIVNEYVNEYTKRCRCVIPKASETPCGPDAPFGNIRGKMGKSAQKCLPNIPTSIA